VLARVAPYLGSCVRSRIIHFIIKDLIWDGRCEWAWMLGSEKLEPVPLTSRPTNCKPIYRTPDGLCLSVASEVTTASCGSTL